MRSQITCITWNKSDLQRSHEAIRRVGGVRADGARFNISRNQCAEDILSGVESYCVLAYGVLLDVHAYEKNGQKFIKTKPTKDQTDGLLSLDQC
jgi:hypothetical protein